MGERVKQKMSYNLVRKPGAGKPHARFDERDVETEHGEASEAPATERAGNRYTKPKTTASHLDSTLGFLEEVEGVQHLWCGTSRQFRLRLSEPASVGHGCIGQHEHDRF